ncbi:hypothetical protein roselon_03605 [Roseibacterium elongatum DSM 19469]|uniref:Uncharacterized protein n=1 Tax=Roseicyclus elongatus DSM 19469 TaxID=1294273 RepID=W8STJ3_9RHOB|nr:hypothetical protein roselon_03605 [Roseibacterium elongatum DSM 19469]
MNRPVPVREKTQPHHTCPTACQETTLGQTPPHRQRPGARARHRVRAIGSA